MPFDPHTILTSSKTCSGAYYSPFLAYGEYKGESSQSDSYEWKKKESFEFTVATSYPGMTFPVGEEKEVPLQSNTY